MRAALYTFGLNTDFVSALTEKGVRVILVGGLAVRYYCPEREADDLDLLVEPTEGAGAAIAEVLFRFSDAAAFQPADFAKPRRHYRQKRALYLDLLTPHEEDDFDALWGRTEKAKLNGASVRVAAVSDLLAMKRRAVAERNDEKDRRDVELLAAVV